MTQTIRLCRMNGFVLRTLEKEQVWPGKRISNDAIRPFTFAKINFTDDSDLATTSEAIVKNLGAIQFPVLRVFYLGDSPNPIQYSDDAKQHVSIRNYSTRCP